MIHSSYSLLFRTDYHFSIVKLFLSIFAIVLPFLVLCGSLTCIVSTQSDINSNARPKPLKYKPLIGFIINNLKSSTSKIPEEKTPSYFSNILRISSFFSNFLISHSNVTLFREYKFPFTVASLMIITDIFPPMS